MDNNNENLHKYNSNLESVVILKRNEQKRKNSLFVFPISININKNNHRKNNNYSKKESSFNSTIVPNYTINSTKNLSIKRGTNKFKKPIVSSLKKENISKPKKIGIPYIKSPTNKKYTLVLDLNKTLAYYDIESGKIKLRNGLFSFLSMVKTYYELISFSCEPINITEAIIKDIERENKYFDYNLNRTHSILYENYLVKDISLIGRDISKIIIIDNDENCFKLNKENGIKIASFNDSKDDDNKLFELKKILILIFKKNYDDVREALKDFSEDIKTKLSLA